MRCRTSLIGPWIWARERAGYRLGFIKTTLLHICHRTNSSTGESSRICHYCNCTTENKGWPKHCPSTNTGLSPEGLIRHSSKFASKLTLIPDMINSPIDDPKLTSGQRELETDLQCNIWQFYNLIGLPINKQEPIQCQDKQPDRHRQFALDCSLVKIIQEQANTIVDMICIKPCDLISLTQSVTYQH